jgi:hypothetical protein
MSSAAEGKDNLGFASDEVQIKNEIFALSADPSSVKNLNNAWTPDRKITRTKSNFAIPD